MTDFGAFQPWTGPGGLLTVEARQHLRKLATAQASGGGGSTAWADITGKPSTFAPSAHGHDWADLTGVPSTFTPSAHTHVIADTTGLQAALDGKQAAGSYAAATHTHTASAISDSTTAGRALLTATDAAAQRTALSLGTAALEATTAFAPALIARMASPFGASAISGQFYDQSFDATGPGTLAGVANRLDLSPFYAPFDLTVDQIGVACSTGVASAVGRCVVYASGTDNWPAARLFYGAADLGFATTGYKAHTLSTPYFTFAANTLYWVGIHQSSTATLRTGSLSGSPNLGVNGSNGTNYFNILRRSVTYASGAPDPWSFVAGDRANGLPVSIRMRAL